MPGDYYYSSFVLANVVNQLKVKPNAVVADDAFMQKCATVQCACKMAAMLTRKTSELTGPDQWSPNTLAFRTSVVTVLLCYFTYLHESNPKLRLLYILILEIWGRAQREAARGVRKQALINF